MARILGGLIDRFMNPQPAPAQPGIVGAMVGAAIDAGIDRFAERVGAPVSAANRSAAEAAGQAAAASVPTATARTGATRNPPPIVDRAIAANNAGLEPLRASRTFMQSLGTVFGGVGITATQLAPLISALSTGDVLAWWNLVGFFLGIGVTGGGFFGIWGRIKDDLPPMTRRLYNPLSWFAPKRLIDTVPPAS